MLSHAFESCCIKAKFAMVCIKAFSRYVADLQCLLVLPPIPPPLILLQRTNHIPQLSLDTNNISYSLPCTAHSEDECDWSCVDPVGEAWCRQVQEYCSTRCRSGLGL